MQMTKKVNKMDKINYPKSRLLESLKTLSIYVEGLDEGEKKDELDLHLAFIIQELNTKDPFLNLSFGKVCSYCNAKHSTHKVKFSRFHLNLLTKIFNYVVKT